MRVLLSLSLLCLVGCSTLGLVRTDEERKQIANDQIREFQYYLTQGYEIYVYKGEVILYKLDDPRGIQIQDVFGVNNK